MRELVVIGGGGHATTVIAVARKLDFHIRGYLDSRDRGSVLGISHLGDDQSFRSNRSSGPKSLALGIGIMTPEGARRRAQLMREYQSLGFEFPNLLSPDAVVNEEVRMGSGVVVADGVVVNSRVRVGDGVILNTRTGVDHDCRIGSHSHVAPGATIAGEVTIGDYCLIGAGTILIEGVHVANGTLVGAGAVVIEDLRESGVFAGNPARRIR